MRLLAWASLALSVSCFTACLNAPTGRQSEQLAGTAEDLWGNQVDLGNFDQGLTLIEPFSPSTCGYCLLVGEFVELNYFEKNRENGGHNFLQSLFSPQLDLYAYQKYYRDTTTVLTYPLSLYEYHRDGYPALLAFRDGRQILNGTLDDYDKTLKERARAWWPESSDTGVILPSGDKMADNYIVEARHALSVLVLPPGMDSLAQIVSNRIAEKSRKPIRTAVKCEDQLSPEDLTRNLIFQGDMRRFTFRSLVGRVMPVRFDSSGFELGPYRFGRDGAGLLAIMPNPYNRECYLSLRLTQGTKLPFGSELQADYAVWRVDDSPKGPQLLIDGRFAKDRKNNWRFADSLSVVYSNLKEFCGSGVCPIPSYLVRPEIHHTSSLTPAVWDTKSGANRLTLGSTDCRFPAVAVSATGETGIAWEENGDINFAVTKENEPVKQFRIEDGDADAYNPKVVHVGQSFLLLYLSNLDGYYHVYGRYLDGDKLSQQFRISEPGAFDDISPALTANVAGVVVVAWSQSKANFRFPKFCMIEQRTVGPTTDISVVPNGAEIGYTNAWGFSLALDRHGKPYGMWNQHYPAMITVCGGPLSGPATTPQKLTGNAETSECGEYPSTAIDPHGDQWVAWGTYGFLAWRGDPQQILLARFDSAKSGWSTPITVSDDSLTFLNQTPRLTIDGKGASAVVWSGRPKGGVGTWGIYLARQVDGRWQKPVLLSEPGETARAPETALGPDGALWVTWHSGVGKRMLVRATVIRN